MIYVGIDIAKLNHFASAMNSDGEVLTELFEFTNNHVGFQKLLDELSKYSKYELLIGMESTAHYAALGPTAHKLVRVIHKMLTDDVAFNLD